MRNFKMSEKFAIVAAVFVSAATLAANATEEPGKTNDLTAVQQKIDAGDCKSASSLTSTLLKSNPADARAHYLLGQAQFKLGKFAPAKVELKEATKLAVAQHLTDVAMSANDLMIKLPKELSAPHQKFAVAKIKGRKVAAAGFARPRLLSFYAAWAEPCKQLSVDLDKVHTEYGEQLEIVKVDVDDPSNQKMMDQYDISPVPTVVFLDTEGKVTNYFVGYDSATELNSSVKKALNK